VGEQRFLADGAHPHMAEIDPNACRACHGRNGQGTVLSKASANRTFTVEGGQVTLTKGQAVSCTLCHENQL
jgi:hypothetical protein